MESVCGMDEKIAKKCKYYDPESFFNCQAEKCDMTEKKKDNYTFDKKAQRKFMKAVSEAIKPLEKALKEFKETISKIDWSKINENLPK